MVEGLASGFLPAEAFTVSGAFTLNVVRYKVLPKLPRRKAEVREIHMLGDPILRQRAIPVAVVDDEVRHFVDDLFGTMNAFEGVGLAANQVGDERRIAVVDTGGRDARRLVLINPRIVERSDEVETSEEGCLSIPDIYGEVERPTSVTFEALDRGGRPYRLKVSGFEARAVQHEIDHLDGVLFLDHLSAVKRGLLMAKWRKSRRGQSGYTREPPNKG